MMDAISMLKQDHRDVEKLFDAFEEGDGDKPEIATQICQLLTVHAQIEEEIFYPAAREALGDDGDDLLDEAEVEHAGAKELISQIESEGEENDLFEAKVTVLGEYIRHHVKEEEGELFPKVKKADLDLESIGRELEARKAELLGAELERAPSGTGKSRAKRKGSKAKAAKRAK